jgi:hypothetical protein
VPHLGPRAFRVVAVSTIGVAAVSTVVVLALVLLTPDAHPCRSTAAGGPGAASAPAAPAAASPAFPLRVVKRRRYLVDANGRPFLIVGDTPWSLAVQLKPDEAERYLESRRRDGFNTILFNLIEHKFATAPPRDAYGEAPFLQEGDFSSPNPVYFDHVAKLLALARSKGFLVLLTPAYAGFRGGTEGWWSEMKASGAEKLRAYGRYVAQRYTRFDNVIWVEGGDFSPLQSERGLMEAVAEGIQSVAPVLQTFHGGRGTSAFAYWRPQPPWLTVNTIYADADTIVKRARVEYCRVAKPFFLIEGTYEGNGVPAAAVRQQAYQTILAGGNGALMGHQGVWALPSGWADALASHGAKGMSELASLFSSLRWWTLRPDLRHHLLTRGIGSGAGEAVAACSSDRSFAVVYLPSTRAITLDLAQLRGPAVAARWLDPTNGHSEPAHGSPYRAPRKRTFSPPQQNAGGDHDFVLLLRSR